MNVENATWSWNRIQESLLAAPKRLLMSEIADLDISLRTVNGLRANGVRTMDELVGLSEHALARFKGFGKKSIVDLCHAITMAVVAENCRSLTDDRNIIDGVATSDPVTCAAIAPPFPDNRCESLSEVLEAFGREEDSRLWRILSARMGYYDKPKTLEDLGKIFGLTRERVRQLERKALQRLERRGKVSDALAQNVFPLFENRHTPLYLETISIELEWLGKAQRLGSILKFLVPRLASGNLFVWEIDEFLVVARVSEEEWFRRRKLCQSFLAENVGSSLDLEMCRIAVHAIAGEELQELAEILWTEVARSAHFATTRDGGSVLVAYGRGVNQMVTAVLESAVEPLHYEEIHYQVCAKYGSQDLRRVHNASDAVGILLGRGIYGRWRHVGVSVADAMYIASFIEGLLREDESGRQWHTSEFLEWLDGIASAANIDHYRLAAILRAHSSLHYVGRQMWATSTHGRGGVHARLDIRGVVESVLQAEGRPMSQQEIHRRVRELRGLGATFQVHPGGEVLRVSAGTWGLRSRDVSIPVSDVMSALSVLERRLIVRQQALHVSELLQHIEASSINERNCWELFGLAQLDTRFRIFAGDFLGLASWRESGRTTPRAAVLEALKKFPMGATSETIGMEAGISLQRALPTDSVRFALRGLGATYDRVSGLWTMDSGPLSFDENDL